MGHIVFAKHQSQVQGMGYNDESFPSMRGSFFHEEWSFFPLKPLNSEEQMLLCLEMQIDWQCHLSTRDLPFHILLEH